MRLDNATDMVAGYTMGMRPDGRELLVVCVKGTFQIPKNGGTPPLLKEQIPLVEADTFTGEPGFSAPVCESDYPPFKPRCDILLNGKAYAPEGKPVPRVPVALQFGAMTKSFLVVGDRSWDAGLLSIKPGRSNPFLRQSFSYDTAFGGVDNSLQDPAKVSAYLQNPVGVGYHYHLESKFVDRKPMPNSEEINQPIKKPNGDYRPMSFGPIGRGWSPRADLAGTYDQKWLDDVFPFLPADFDDAYYQSAPTDQQAPYPQGGEPVALINLTPEGKTVFRFPKVEVLVWFFMKNGEEKEHKAVVDTVMIEPEAGRFSVTSRTALPLRRNMFEVEFALVGGKPEDRFEAVGEEEIAFPFPLTFEEGTEEEREGEI